MPEVRKIVLNLDERNQRTRLHSVGPILIAIEIEIDIEIQWGIQWVIDIEMPKITVLGISILLEAILVSKSRFYLKNI